LASSEWLKLWKKAENGAGFAAPGAHGIGIRLDPDGDRGYESAMKRCLLLMLVGVVGVCSCDRVRTVVNKFRKQSEKPSAPVVEPGNPLVSELTEGTYPAFVTQPGRLVVIDFYADWCVPCRQLSPLLDRLAEKHRGTVVVGKVNVDRCQNLAGREGIRSIPEVRMFLNGKQVDRFVGVPPESDIARRFAAHTKGRSAIQPPGTDGADAAGGQAPGAPAAPPGSPGSAIQPMPKDWVPAPFERPKK
jgi:thioredoxin